jgi:hypothetical protein
VAQVPPEQPGLLQVIRLHLIIVIPTLLHTHLASSTLSYTGLKLGASSVTLHLAGLGVKIVFKK